MSVLIETTAGNFVIDLYTQDCPQTSYNFLKLCKVKYYNFTLCHRVESGFTVQMGDDVQRSGGQSIFAYDHRRRRRFIEHEFSKKHRFNRRGLVAMTASTLSSSGVNGSQFFITLSDQLSYLNEKHTIFGEVAEGSEWLDAVENVLVDSDLRPFVDVRIKHTYILHDPFEDPAFLPEPASPEPPRLLLDDLRWNMDVELKQTLEDDDETKVAKLKQKEIEAKELTLEMLGDLPFAGVKPPENILFVAKLNPFTSDKDLQLIFSRFGKILSCEIIKDKVTGRSLKYAFVEFEEKASAEEAYFKMQNVLIDDRRIHVDFSQSVSKLHGDWLQQRMLNSSRDTGLGRGLVQRKQYRDDRETSAARYDLVFDDEPQKKRQRQ
jgi:peptidyl-prolyl cis-trans isomerase-like 4